jgi:hypothetical protein
VQASDLKDTFDKLSKEASSLASDITGPLKNLLTNGGNPLDALAQMGQNVLGTLVQSQIIDPLQKQLEGLFGGLLGIGAPGSSPAKPMYVLDAAGGLGGGGGGGILGSLFGGGGGGAIDNMSKTASSGGIFDSIFSWFSGLFDEGGVIPPGHWGIKSGKAEIIQGGTHGVSIAPLASPRVTAALSHMASVAANGNAAQSPRSHTGGVPMQTVHNWNFYGPTDGPSVLRARSQAEASFTRIASRGQRGT